MTIDEVIILYEGMAEANRKIVDTHCISDELTIDELYCDDTEIIEEKLALYKKDADNYRQFAEWLKELKQLREQTRWIPVSEKLPEDYQRVLVTVVNYWGIEVVRVAEYSNQKKIFQIKESNDKWKVGEEGLLAWMPLPLPKPYKESED
jgi:hypothetical protein